MNCLKRIVESATPDLNVRERSCPCRKRLAWHITQHNGLGLDDSIITRQSFLILDRCLQTTSHLHPTSLTNRKPSHPQVVPRIIPRYHDVPMIMFSTLHCVSVSVFLLFTHVVVVFFFFGRALCFACTPFSPASFVSALASALASLLFTMRIV